MKKYHWVKINSTIMNITFRCNIICTEDEKNKFFKRNQDKSLTDNEIIKHVM